MTNKSDAQRRPFAVFDIDGTLIRWQLYHALADNLAGSGDIGSTAYKTMKDARMAWKRRNGGSFRDYESRVIELYESVLKNLTHKQFETAAQSVFEEYKDQVYIYTRDLIEKLKSEGYYLLAISGSQTEIVAKIAEYYAFDDYVGTTYARTAKGYSGEKTIGSLNKNQTLKQLVKKHNLDFNQSVGVGDSHSDIAMLKLVDFPIALNPEAQLFKTASKLGWTLVIERKNMIYQLERKDGEYQLVKTD